MIDLPDCLDAPDKHVGIDPIKRPYEGNVKRQQEAVLGVREMSGSVAHGLSGFEERSCPVEW